MTQTTKPESAERRALTLSGPGKAKARRIDATELLGESREIVLVYKGMDYQLRLTSNDKLILTK